MRGPCCIKGKYAISYSQNFLLIYYFKYKLQYYMTKSCKTWQQTATEGGDREEFGNVGKETFIRGSIIRKQDQYIIKPIYELRCLVLFIHNLGTRQRWGVSFTLPQSLQTSNVGPRTRLTWWWRQKKMWDLRFWRRWLWKWLSYGIWRRVVWYIRDQYFGGTCCLRVLRSKDRNY
jgi:hypothetical protein